MSHRQQSRPSERARLFDGIEGARLQYLFDTDGDADDKPGGKGLTRRAIFIHPFCDYLLLRYQQPCSISLWATSRDGTPPRYFTSLRNRDRAFYGQPVLQDIPPVPSANPFTHVVESDCGRVTVAIESLPVPEADRIELPLDARHDVQGALDAFVDDVVVALSLYRLDVASDLPCIPADAPLPPGLTLEVALQPLRRRLGEYFASLHGRTTFAVDGHESHRGALNLFTVVRYRPDAPGRGVAAFGTDADAPRELEYPYTAQVLLTPSQRKWVERLLRDKGFPVPDAQLLEAPLGPGSRAIADSVFSSGLIDFGLPGERGEPWSRDLVSAKRDTEGELRRSAEKLIYEAIYGNDEYRILYIPIHVGGTPWLALYTFDRATRGTASEGAGRAGTFDRTRPYLLYRDLVPTIGAAIRELSQRAYADFLAALVQRAFDRHGSGALSLSSINELWSHAPRFYPFQRASLVRFDGPADEGCIVVTLPDHTRCRIELSPEPHPALARQVAFGAITAKEIRRTLEPVMTAHLRQRHRMSSVISEAVGHTLKTYMTLTAWRGVRRKLLSGARRAGDGNTRSLLMKAANATGLCSLSEGLGGLVRLSGIVERGEYEKLENWVDADLHAEWSKYGYGPFVEEFAESVFTVATLACTSLNWSNVAVTWRRECDNPVRREWSWSEEAELSAPFSAARLSFPPYARGPDAEDAKMALLPAIAEPIVNAIKVLWDIPDAAGSAIEIDVSASPADGVAVEFCNRILPPQANRAGSLPSGLRSTQGLAEVAAGVARYELPTVRQDAAGQFFYAVRLILHPAALTTKILSTTNGGHSA